ncbi:MAG: flagellar hook-associated protein FlgK, partial [Rhodoferax sp.]|nr:flagellar hook-associated protein FlgK [Rhodoferax sp.]
RLEQLRKLEDLFPGGASGLGAAMGEMLNAFSDVANAPTDLTARTVVLARADELAARFRSTASSMDALRDSLRLELASEVRMVNSLATRIADVNRQISNAMGSGHTPNDLLDQRDELIRELNTHVQTTTIAAADGTMSVFVASSQPLVLGTTASQVALQADDFGDPYTFKLTMQRNNVTAVMDEALLGGGSLSGLMKFNNHDLADAG